MTGRRHSRADLVQFVYGYKDTIRLLELRAPGAEMARALPRVRGVEHVRRGGTRGEEGRRVCGAGDEEEGGGGRADAEAGSGRDRGRRGPNRHERWRAGPGAGRRDRAWLYGPR